MQQDNCANMHALVDATAILMECTEEGAHSLRLLARLLGAI